MCLNELHVETFKRCTFSLWFSHGNHYQGETKGLTQKKSLGCTCHLKCCGPGPRCCSQNHFSLSLAVLLLVSVKVALTLIVDPSPFQLACYDQAKQLVLGTGVMGDNIFTHFLSSFIAVSNRPLSATRSRSSFDVT